MAIQDQTDKEADKEPSGLQTMPRQMLRRQRNLQLYLLLKTNPDNYSSYLAI